MCLRTYLIPITQKYRNNHLFQSHILKAYNKIDQVSIEEVDRLARMPHTVVIR